MEEKTRTTYEVQDADGRLVAEHVRVDMPDGKRVFWRREDGTVGLDGMPTSDLPLYGSESVGNWHPDDLIVLVEGEKARDALEAAMFRALGTVTGAGGTPGAAALDILRGRRVCLWPDNDEQGRAHMERIAERLDRIAAEVLVYTWDEAPEKGDAADHPAVRSGSEKALDRLWTDLEGAPRQKPITTITNLYSENDTVTPIRFSEMDPPGSREYAVEGIVPKGHTTTIYGDGGSAKSVIALSAATAIAGDAERWMGRRVANCPTLYIDFELDADEQRRRAYQVARGVCLERPPHDLLYVSGLGRPSGEILEGCLDVCEEYGAGFVVIDSLGIALQGEAESASDVIRFHHKYLDPFRAAGVTLLVIDHQGKSQANESYQNKRTFGSVYKENLARSVLQVQPGDRGSGLLAVKIRQTKHNFGPKAEPFGARLAFTEEQITVSEHSLDPTELVQEETLNNADRVLMVLTDRPAYPADAAERSGLPVGSVKNALTELRRRGLVEYTDEVNSHTKAREVRLTDDGRTVMGVTTAYRGRDTVTPAPFLEEAI